MKIEIYNLYIDWKGLRNIKTDALNYPLYITGFKKPRAYQETAIKRVVENITKGNKKTLLTMATGTGKTFMAFHGCICGWHIKLHCPANA